MIKIPVEKNMKMEVHCNMHGVYFNLGPAWTNESVEESFLENKVNS